MRKVLFTMILAFVIIWTALVITKGIEFGKFEVWGIKKIMTENDNIDGEIEALSSLTKQSYQSALTSLNSSETKMKDAKEEYESQAVLLANNEYYGQTEKYKLEFLWTRLGNYAKDNDVEIKIDVTNSATAGMYDLNFSISGRYPDVAKFIYDIENDSRLGFKIENFSMTASSNGVLGCFTCKEIRIDIEKIETSSEDTTEENTDDTVEDGKTENTNNKTVKNNNSNEVENKENLSE